MTGVQTCALPISFKKAHEMVFKCEVKKKKHRFDPSPWDQSHASGSALAFGQFLRRFTPIQTTRRVSQTRSSPRAPGEGQLTLNNPQDLSQMLTQRFEENSGHVASTEVNNNNEPNGQKQGNPAANVHYRLDSPDLGGYSLWLASLSHGWSLQDLSPLD